MQVQKRVLQRFQVQRHLDVKKLIIQGIKVSRYIKVRPVAQLAEHRTPNLLPVRARVRDASALDIHIEASDGDGLRSGQRPQPVEVSERGGPCPAMWAR